ncbi:MAG: choice-of-anchor K domain-containing protein [Methanothrix sp.]
MVLTEDACVPIGENFCIGELTHFNYPIHPSAATQATLSVTLQFVDPAISSTFSFDLGIDETLNGDSCEDCSYEPCELPCPDMISILSAPGPQTFSVNDKSYTIEILGFTDTCPGGNPEQEVITQENRATTIYLVGRLQELGADLSITKTDSPDPVMAGGLLTYVLTVTNGGPSDATGVQLTDASAPDYLDNIEYRIGSNTWSPFPAGQSISLGNLVNGDSIIIEIRGTVPADAADGTILSNTAHVASQIFDPNMVNNQAEAQTLVGPIKPSPQESALPKLKKNASSSTVAPGGIITYTIDFTCPQQDAVIQEKYPMGVSFVSSSPPPDSGTNDRWTFHGQSSGTIIVAVRAPHDPNIIFHLEQKAGGVGFMRAYKDLSTGREALVMVNTVVMTYTENSVSGSLSAESAVAVSGGAGTETALRESGSGEYSSEELLNYYRCNRSIRDTSNLSASYQPSSFRLPGGRTVNYSSKWASADNSKNYLTSESIESQYLLAGKIDKESDIHLDRNGTKISTDSEFEGMYQSEYQKLAEPDSKGHRSVEKELGSSYSGSFKIKERLATTFSKRPNAITSVKHYDEPHVTVYQRSEQDQTNENNLNYTISILNDGNRALGPIHVSDIFPAGTYFLDSSTRPTEPRMEDLSESRYANWTFAHLPLGQAVTIYLRVIRYVVLDVPINAVYVSAGYDGQWFNASNITATNSNWLSCTPQGICTRSQSGGWNPPNWGFDLTKDICSFCPSGLMNVADGQNDCPECTL